MVQIKGKMGRQIARGLEQGREKKHLENDIVIFLLGQNISNFGLWSNNAACFFLRLRLFPCCEDLSISSSSISLLLAGDLLEAVELLSIKFVELGVDICILVSF